MEKKRPRDEEEANEASKKPTVVAYTNAFNQGSTQQKIYFLTNLPKDLLVFISKLSSVGVFLIMAQTNNMFAAIARDDNIWIWFFKRDFPHEFEFCGGRLPFYIITKGHILFREGLVNPYDESGWKRFYLHTRKLYREVFEYNNPNQSPDFSTQYDAVRQLCSLRNYKHLIVWRFVGCLAKLFHQIDHFDNVQEPRFFVNLERKPWLIKYFLCSCSKKRDEDDNWWEMYRPQRTVPASMLFYKEYAASDNYDYDETMKTLFSPEDRQQLFDFDPHILPIWDMCSALFHSKSIYSYLSVVRISFSDALFNTCGIWSILNPDKINLSNFIEQFNTEFEWEGEQWQNISSFQQLMNFGSREIISLFYNIIDPFGWFYNIDVKERLIQEYYNLLQKYLQSPRTGPEKKISFLEKCIECQVNDARFLCGDCNSVQYCGQECQKNHWIQSHRKECNIKTPRNEEF